MAPATVDHPDLDDRSTFHRPPPRPSDEVGGGRTTHAGHHRDDPIEPLAVERGRYVDLG